MANNAPGRHYRKSITVEQIHRMFSTDKKAEKWFIEARWGKEGDMFCPRCGSTKTKRVKHPTMPFHCSDCRKRFSVKTGTVMESSKIPLRQWAVLVYTEATELRGTPSMKLHRDVGITQKSAWFMLHRIRESYASMCEGLLEEGGLQGSIELDETAVGGKASLMNKKQHRAFKARGGAQGFSGKEIIAGAKQRESGKIVVRQIDNRDRESLQKLVTDFTAEGATVYTDEARGYRGMENRTHQAVNHSANKYVMGQAHTNGMESFWFAFKRGLDSFISVSPKHVIRYAIEFAGRHNDRPLDTMEQMRLLACGMVGKRLTYKDLIADNGRSNFAKPVAGSEEEQVLKMKQAEKEALKDPNCWDLGIPPEWVEGYEGTTGIGNCNTAREWGKE